MKKTDKQQTNSIKHQIQEVIKANAGRLSYGSRHNLECNLHAFGRYLKERFRGIELPGLGRRHIDAYIEHLKQKGSKVRTVINTITHLRFLARAIGKKSIVHRTNAEYGFERTSRIDNINRAVTLTPEQLDSLGSRHHSFKTAAVLQRLFALRMEEAGMFIVHQADHLHYVAMAGSWCKNGRPRNIPITTSEQRAFLDVLKNHRGKNESVAGNGYETMKRWKLDYLAAMKKIGAKSHGLRHATLQAWYEKWTGFKAPINGGPRIRELPREQRESVESFCYQLSESIGHSRPDVLGHYLGRL